MIVLPPLHPSVRCWQEHNALHIDVRDWLRQGGKPYALLMACLRQIGAEDVLVVHAPFDPQPLRDQARRLGVAAAGEELDPEHWAITFRRRA